MSALNLVHALWVAEGTNFANSARLAPIVSVARTVTRYNLLPLLREVVLVMKQLRNNTSTWMFGAINGSPLGIYADTNMCMRVVDPGLYCACDHT